MVEPCRNCQKLQGRVGGLKRMINVLHKRMEESAELIRQGLLVEAIALLEKSKKAAEKKEGKGTNE